MSFQEDHGVVTTAMAGSYPSPQIPQLNLPVQIAGETFRVTPYKSIMLFIIIVSVL